MCCVRKGWLGLHGGTCGGGARQKCCDSCCLCDLRPVVPSLCAMPQIVCSHGPACHGAKCTFHHLSPAANFAEPAGVTLSQNPCRSGANCTNPRCRFNHPSPNAGVSAAVVKADVGPAGGDHPRFYRAWALVNSAPGGRGDSAVRGGGVAATRGRGATSAIPAFVAKWTPNMGNASEVSYAAPVIKVSQEMDNPLKLALAVGVRCCTAMLQSSVAYLHLAQQRLAFKRESNVCFVLQSDLAPSMIKSANTHVPLAAPKNPSTKFK
jgi:hypothetical protein